MRIKEQKITFYLKEGEDFSNSDVVSTKNGLEHLDKSITDDLLKRQGFEYVTQPPYIHSDSKGEKYALVEIGRNLIKTEIDDKNSEYESYEFFF